MALLFFCFSMTPSLLPRPWYLQGIAGGITAATGYAVGVSVTWLLRAFGFRPLQRPHQRRVIVQVLTVAAITAIPLFGILGAIWQYHVRIATNADRTDSNYYALVLLIAFTLGRALLSIARLLRRTARRIGQFGARWIPLPVSKLIAAAIVVALVTTAMADILLPALLAATNASFATVDNGTAPGAHRPVSPQRSGSPASLVRWDDLGLEGRTFVGTGPTAADIAAFTGSPAMTPIRVYAGVRSADSLAAEADLVVRELERTGAFDRAVLVVATATGRGWVNAVAAAAVEYEWGGDSAIASMQYSYLPSPVAFLTDRDTPPEAGRVLFDAVHQAWASRPTDHRPKLLLTGESLGSYGSQGAFDSLADVTSSADGAVWAGTPNFTPLWRGLTARRDARSPEQRPVVDRCREVCFLTEATDLPSGAHPDVVFLQHVNDPIVWWSPALLLRRPEWLAEPALPGRPQAMTYIPLVTFWQVTMDNVFSTDMPDGSGHTYAADYVNAFAAVAPPPGWTAADTERLRRLVADFATGG